MAKFIGYIVSVKSRFDTVLLFVLTEYSNRLECVKRVTVYFFYPVPLLINNTSADQKQKP